MAEVWYYITEKWSTEEHCVCKWRSRSGEICVERSSVTPVFLMPVSDVLMFTAEIGLRVIHRWITVF